MNDKPEKKSSGIETKIKKARNEKGLSQKEVAELVGISHSTYVKIEIGKTEKIFIDVGKAIAKALGLSFNELFDIESFHSENELKEKLLELENKAIKLQELVEFLTKNNLLLAVASQLYHDENPDRPLTRNFNDTDSLLKEVSEMPYDPADPQSQYLYIMKRLDKLRNGKKE